MKLSIKNRIYLSFSILAALFIINGVIIIITLNNNHKVSRHLTQVVDPSLQSLNDFKSMLILSREFSVNWVFLRMNGEYKKTLREIHSTGYPNLQAKLNAQAAKWVEPQIKDSLDNMFASFEKVIVHEKTLMNTLSKFDDYDDPVKKFGAEELLEHDVIPGTNSILNTLNNIILAQQKIKATEQKKAENAALFMRVLIISIAITIIGLAIFLSWYMKKIIIGPIDKIIKMVDDLGKGITKKIYNHLNEDEIGRMIKSVNILTDNLSASALFADEIGKRNFVAEYKPLSNEDKLGKALIAMRDNLKKSDESLNEAQHIVHMGSWERDFKHDKVSWSDEMFRIFDLEPSPDGTSYEIFLNYIHPEDKEYVNGFTLKYLKDHEPFEYECRIISQKGVHKIIYVQGNVIVDEKGEVTKTQGITHDITSRKKAEEAVQQSEKRFRSLIENNDDAISLLDKESNILYQSPAAERMLGFTIEERNELPSVNNIHPDDLAASKKVFAQALQNPGVSFPFQHRKLHKQGYYVWVEGTITNMFENESVNAIVANFRDITRRKDAERAMYESENKYRELFETMLDGVYKSSSDGRFIEVNPALVKMLGYNSKEELLAIDIKSQLYFESSDRDKTVLDHQANGIEIYRLRKKSGAEIWVEERGQYVKDEKGNVLYHEGILRDVTKRIHTELQLVKSMKETDDYKKALDQSLIVSITDQNGDIKYVNDNFCKISKYSAEELIGHNYRTLDLSRHANAFIRKMTTAVTGREVWRGELKNKTKDGAYFWVDSTTVPFINEKGQLYQYLTISVDITERKKQQAAIEKSNTELRKSNHELDKFVYSISHDLRAPLLSMLGVVEITADMTAEEQTLEHMKMLRGSINRLDGLIGEILEYSRNARNEVKHDIIDFKKMLDDLSDDLKVKNNTTKPVDIQININEEGTLYSDKGRISMVLHNLVSNAITYHNPNQENPYVKINVNTDEDKSLIEIEDNGIGISNEYHEKVFEMFYRGDENSNGSGLGLYIAKETVEKLNGDISIESKPGLGTKFKLSFPNLLFQRAAV